MSSAGETGGETGGETEGLIFNSGYMQLKIVRGIEALFLCIFLVDYFV